MKQKPSDIPVECWPMYLVPGDVVWYEKKKWKIERKFMKRWDTFKPTFSLVRRTWLGKKIRIYV